MTSIDDLTETERQALRGELSEDEYNVVGMDLFKKGLCAIRSAPVALDQPTPYTLTEEGIRLARQLREEQSND
jgi:hypothetical protein